MGIGVPEWPVLVDNMVAFERDEEGDWWIVGCVLSPGEVIPHIEVLPLPDVEGDDE